jgi:hypothetical protein
MVANAFDFSTECHQSLGRDSNPRPAAYKAAALPLSYPGWLGFRSQVSAVRSSFAETVARQPGAILPSGSSQRLVSWDHAAPDRLLLMLEA